MELTDKQLTLWKERGSDFSAPPHLCQQALAFYQAYKQTEPISLEKADIVLKVAYFLAEKAQVLYDREGHRLNSIAISANSILRDHPKHEEFLYHLLQMVRSITMPPDATHLEEEVALFSRHFSSSLTFLNKLKATLRKIKINRKVEEPGEYPELATRLLWLVFVDCRSDLQIGVDIIESTCLLGCILSFYILEKYQEESLFSIYFENESEGCTLPNEIEELSSILMAYLHIKDTQTYLTIYSKMLKYFAALERIVDIKRFFSCQTISKNIYLVQKLYEKKLSDGRLDESIFLKGSTLSNQPAMRLTPFGRKAPLAPKTANALSHRILNFENWDEGQEKGAFADNKKEDKASLHFLNKLKLQPTPKGTLIRATPMSEAMEVYNWLFEKSNRFNLSKEELMMIEGAFEVSLIKDQVHQSKRDHRELAGALWKESLEKYENISQKTLLLLSVYIVCHVLNAPTHDIRVPIELLQLSSLEVWEALDYLINTFDKHMPLSLKMTLLTLETSFISHRLWQDEENIQRLWLSSKLHNMRLTKRVVHQGAYILNFLSKKLELCDELTDSSFLIFQQALQTQSDLLHEKMLEHIIICSLYASAKVKEHPLKFNEILAAIKEVLGLASGPFNEMVEGVKIGDRRENIIIYYNTLFVPPVRQYLKQMRQSCTPESSPGFLSTKIKEVVTREANALASPQMASYFAYCESPMLKNRCLRELNMNLGGVSQIGGTAKRESAYGLADIEAKCSYLCMLVSKFGGSVLKQTRKVKY